MKKCISLLMAAVMLLGLLSGCGGSSSATVSKGYGAMQEAVEAPAAMMMDASANELTANSAGSSASLPENRKWIITVDMHAETDDLDTMLAALDEKIAAMQGYVENQNIYNGSTYANRRYRNANLTVRVPADTVETFTQEVSGIANVVRNQVSKEDVTLRYVDTESRKLALEAEQKRLMELLEQAETMSDLLEIEARLTEVRYQLESTASQLRTYDNQIDYATIYLYIEEVQEYTPIVEKTVWQRITEGFADSLESLSESLVDLFVWLIVSSPFILVYGGILIGIFLLVRMVRKKAPKKSVFKKNRNHSGESKSE